MTQAHVMLIPMCWGGDALGPNPDKGLTLPGLEAIMCVPRLQEQSISSSHAMLGAVVSEEEGQVLLDDGLLCARV